MTEDEFANGLAALAATFDVDMGEAKMEGYWLALNEMTVTQFQRACSRALKECDYFPKPVELLHLGGQIQTEDVAEFAFQAVVKELHRRGTYESVNFDDPTINATVRALGGWTYLGTAETKEMQAFIRPRFISIYKTYMRSGISEDAGRHLEGRIELANRLGGHEPPKVLQLSTGLVDESRRHLVRGEDGRDELVRKRIAG